MSARQIVLVCAAHPDDEILGCGATMARHVAAGDEVHIVILVRDVTSRGAQGDEADSERAARRAGEVIGVRSVRCHDFPDNRLDSVDRLTIVKAVEEDIARVRPTIVYTHFGGDMNVDHGRVHDAVAVACRPTPGHSVETLLFFEVPSSTEWRPPGSLPAFAPTWFVDVSATLATKLEALGGPYRNEMRPFPHARSLEAVEHLARWRGASVGVAAAEAFVCGRRVDRAESRG
jgi:N-acetylglucosamine malate deacetylase 1